MGFQTLGGVQFPGDGSIVLASGTLTGDGAVDTDTDIGVGVNVAGTGTPWHVRIDYSSITDAVNAGHNIVNVVDDTLEPAGQIFAPSSGLYLRFLSEATAVFDDTTIDLTNGNLTIVGLGTIQFTIGAFSSAIDNLVSGRIAKIDGMVFRNLEGAGGNKRVIETNGGSLYMTNCSIIANDATDGGIRALGGETFLSNIHFVGGGTSCQEILRVGNGARFVGNNIVFTGTYGSTIFDVDTSDSGPVILNNVAMEVDAASPQGFLSHNSRLSNFINKGADSFVFRSNTTVRHVSIQNSHFGDGDPLPDLFEDFSMTNCVASGGLTIGDISNKRATVAQCRTGGTNPAVLNIIRGEEHSFSSLYHSETLRVSGSGHLITGSTIIGDLTLMSDTSGVVVSNCRIGGVFTDNGIDNVVDFVSF